jgi:hypothetical protein
LCSFRKLRLYRRVPVSGQAVEKMPLWAFPFPMPAEPPRTTGFL